MNCDLLAPTEVPFDVPGLYTHFLAARSKEECKNYWGGTVGFGLLFLKILEGSYSAAANARRLFEAHLLLGRHGGRIRNATSMNTLH